MASLKKKKFGLGAVSLVVGRLPRYDLAVMKEVDIEIESLLNNIGFFSDAPFERASLVFRYAERENPSVKIGSIDTKYHDLPLTGIQPHSLTGDGSQRKRRRLFANFEQSLGKDQVGTAMRASSAKGAIHGFFMAPSFSQCLMLNVEFLTSLNIQHCSFTFNIRSSPLRCYPTMQVFSGATATTSCEDQKRTEAFNALRYRERLIA